MIIVVLTFPLAIILNFIGVAWYLNVICSLVIIRFRNHLAIVKILKYIFFPLIVLELIIYYQQGLIKVIDYLIQFVTSIYKLIILQY